MGIGRGARAYNVPQGGVHGERGLTGACGTSVGISAQERNREPWFKLVKASPLNYEAPILSGSDGS